MRFALALMATLCFAGATAHAATISVVVSSDNSSCFNNIDATCSSNGSGTFDDWGSSWSSTNGTSPTLVGDGSTAASFSIDAVTAADDGGADVGQSGDRRSTAALNFDITLTIDVDGPLDTWTVDLSQGALGLYAFRGDGTASAVGTQDNGQGSISLITTLVDGNPFNFQPTPTEANQNPSNNSSASTQFSGSRNDLSVLSGMGDAVFSVNIDFDISALSNDGCSGFICSSASGGEEAAVLFGRESVMDQAVDEYSTWGRSIGPDGYNSTWTLNVTVAEPGAVALLALGAAGLVLMGRARR